MTKSVTKTFVAIVLLTTLFVQISSNTYASFSQNEIIINTIQSIITDDEWIDVSEYNGHYYYYHDTEDYTTTIEINPQKGIFEIFHKDKKTDVITYQSVDMPTELSNTRRAFAVDDVIDIMEGMSKLVSEGDIVLDNVLDTEVTIQEYTYNLSERNISPFSSVTNSRVIRELNFTGYREYGYTFIYSTTQNGFVGQVYENQNFRTVNVRAMRTTAHLTVTAVATLISVPVGVVPAIIAVVDLGRGLVAAYTSTVDEHRVNVVSIRQGRVNGVNLLTPGKDTQINVILGDIGETSRLHWISEDWGYSDRDWIAKEAIWLYRLNTGQ